MSTMIKTAITCPSWCRTDHEAERVGWAAREEAMARYMRAPENQAEMRRAFGPAFTPPAEKAPEYSPVDAPLHEQEVGRVHLPATGGGTTPVRVVVQQLHDVDELASIQMLHDANTQAYDDDVYTAQEARSLAALLVVAAQVLEA